MITLLQTLIAYLARCGRSLVTGWDRFFFHPKDPVMLGVIRLMVGSVLLYIHLSCAGDVLNFIGPDAWVDTRALPEIANLPRHFNYQPPEITAETPPEKIPPQYELDEAAVQRRFLTNYGFSLWFWVTDPTWVQITYFAGLVCVACFFLGLLTPVMAVVSWGFHLSYVQRAMTIWFGMDAMLAFLLLYLMIGPCGRAFSLDRLIARFRAGQPLPPATPTWSATIPLRLIQLHMCVVYFFAGVSKLEGKTWWLGNATWLTMNAPLFNESLDIDWIASPALGEWFWHYFCFFGTYATLAFEIGFPFLIWNRRLRPWFLFGAFVLHLGIGLFMGLGAFGLVMLAGCMAFVPPSGMRWFLRCLSGKNLNSQ